MSRRQYSGFGSMTEVTLNLIIINVLMYIGTYLLMGDAVNSGNLINEISGEFSDWERYRLALFSPLSEYFRPYQLVTHMFMHGSLMHLGFNMYTLYILGPPVEARLGPQKYLAYYLLTGFGAMGLHMLVSYLEVHYGGVSPFSFNVPVLGASGAVFGILAAFGMLYPNHRLVLLFPPIPIKAKYFVLILGAIELSLGFSGYNTGIAHFAHLGGAIFGALLLLMWKMR